MFELQFMTGAAILNILHVFPFLMVPLLLYFAHRAYAWNNSYIVELVMAAFFLIFGLYINFGSNQPKISIDVDTPPALEQYMENRTIPEFVTPPPRAQNLDGFKPLGE